MMRPIILPEAIFLYAKHAKRWINALSRLIFFIAQFVILGLAVAFVVVWIRPELLPARPMVPPATQTYAPAVNQAAPSVVSIYTRTMVQEPLALRSTNPLFRALNRDRVITRPRSGLGSGVILDETGHVVTARHVIANVDDIAVALWDGRVAEAQVVGTDPDTDLAVLKIDLDDLPSAQFALERLPRVGDVALAIGNAFGLNHTVTIGIISALGRGQLNLTSLENFIQTDAAINAGNSGGALINAQGEVIGINSASLSQTMGAQGIGFAIPAPIVRTVADQIIEYGQVQRGWIGVQLMDVPLPLAGQGGAWIGGARLIEVTPGGPASEAGLVEGDVIVAVDGEPITDARVLSFEIAQSPPGTVLEVDIARANQRFTTELSVEQQPQP